MMHSYLNAARRWYGVEIRVLDRLRDMLFLILRLYFGYKLMISGRGKLANPEETAAYFQDLQIPLPELNVYMAGMSELLGGLFLALGLASRVATLPVIGTMLVAYITAHPDQWAAFWTNTPIFIKAPPFAYLLTAIIILVSGPGRFSLDYVLGRMLDRKEAVELPTADGAIEPQAARPV